MISPRKNTKEYYVVAIQPRKADRPEIIRVLGNQGKKKGGGML